MKTISIIIPAHNEEKRIERTLKEYYEFFKDKKNKKEIDDFELLVVINNSKDKTEEIVKRFSKDFKEIRYLNFVQGGKGFALIQGFRDSLVRDRELIGFVDADMATPPEAFYWLVKAIRSHDAVIASRGLKESKVETSFKRKLTNKGFNLVVRTFLLMPFKDTQCGAKLFKRKALSEVIDELGITQWAFDIDLLYRLRKKGFKIKEIPTIWNDIEGSKLSLLRTPMKMFASVVRLRLLNSPFKSIVRIYDLLPAKLKFHNF